ncbi:hypothetical protein ACGF4C_26255 [Streptomyces sp. NPDC048197]|uniref:hypothetical protein n=1 Tax=Streptomyces sp. NPDC048197 TaxID=3365511 RepID=UPI0037103E42
MTIGVEVLLDALDQTQPVRHARGIGALTEAHVDALIKLDDHISLRRLSEARQDSEWVKDQIRDRYEQQRAADYLHLIGEAEAERRASGAIEYLPTDPKERLIDFGLDECPVCSYEALRVTGMDDFGLGVGGGTCIVCSYVRSSATADDQAMDFMIARHIADD